MLGKGLIDKEQITEQFRTIRTNIRFSLPGREIKTITVASCHPGEGKSTVISNLALIMAQGGKKVVIIDCDLKKPSIHRKLQISNAEGLTNILVEDKEIEEVIHETEKENVYVITSGPIPPNPSELLNGNNIKHALIEIESKFDMVLIDTPPILYSSDALIMSAHSEGTIIVSAYGKTDKLQLLNVKEGVEKAGGRILGVIINKIPQKYNRNYRSY